jgi:hypothetical protein
VNNKYIKKTIVLLVLVVFICGCQTTSIRRKDYTKFNEESPVSILIVPVVNESVDVDASEYFLSTITIPVAEKGYYVFPVNMVKRVLEDNGLSDAGFVHRSSPVNLCKKFGADAVFYITIHRWEAKYIILSTTVTVDIEYKLVSGKTNELLWGERRVATYSSDSSANTGGGLIGALVSAAVSAALKKIAPEFLNLTKQANNSAINPENTGLLDGKYLLIEEFTEPKIEEETYYYEDDEEEKELLESEEEESYYYEGYEEEKVKDSSCAY